jgi:hypothetical protein
VARNGLIARDVLGGSRTGARVSVVPDAAGTLFDLVLVAVRSDQLAAACSQLTGLAGSPAVVFFGNNPEERPAVRGDVMLGFPGVGGAMREGTAEYVRIRQQPTAVQAGTGTRLGSAGPSARHARVRGPARCRHGGVARLPRSLRGLRRRCLVPVRHRSWPPGSRPPGPQAHVRSGDRGIRCRAPHGCNRAPRNLAVLHNPLLIAVAVRYRPHTMRSPMCELCFAAHARHAQAEMRVLGDQVASRIGNAPAARHLRQLLQAAPAEAASP